MAKGDIKKRKRQEMRAKARPGQKPRRLCVYFRSNHTPTRAPSFLPGPMKSTGLPGPYAPSGARAPPLSDSAGDDWFTHQAVWNRLDTNLNEHVQGTIKSRAGLMRDRLFTFAAENLVPFLRPVIITVSRAPPTMLHIQYPSQCPHIHSITRSLIPTDWHKA